MRAVAPDPSVGSAAVALLGRDRECAVVDRLLAGARSGRGGCLVLGGVAGIGKTALVDHAVAAADGFRIAAVAGSA